MATRLHTLPRPLTLSVVQGALHPPLLTNTLSGFFTNHILANHALRPALICRKERPNIHGGPSPRNLGAGTHLAWDFQEFDRHIGALTRGLLAIGVKKGDRVAVIMGNNR